MSEILKATCKGKSTNIECRRPSWESIKMSYATINNEYKKGAAEAVFKKIGGEPYKEFVNNERAITIQNEQIQQGIQIAPANRRYTLNSCALRISYALNYSKLLGESFLLKYKKLPSNTGELKYENKRWYGSDGNLYYLSIYGIRNFLTLNWGNSDKPYYLRTFRDRDEVAKFDNNEFSKFDRSGIVVMRIKGFVDAGGHTTLWNGEDKHFEDFEISENYLIGNHNVVDFQFWELKG